MKIFYTVYKLIISGLFITFIYSTIIFSQQEIDQSYQYLSPVPGSVMNLPETNVIIKYWKPFNAQDILNKNILEVNGDKSGNHTGKLILAEKNQSIIYIPDIPFTEGENVNVKFLKPVRTVDDELIPALIFNFRITEKDMNSVIKKNPEEYFLKMNPEFQNTFKPQTRSVSNTYSVFDKSLPEDFPVLGIDSINNPAP